MWVCISLAGAIKEISPVGSKISGIPMSLKEKLCPGTHPSWLEPIGFASRSKSGLQSMGGVHGSVIIHDHDSPRLKLFALPFFYYYLSVETQLMIPWKPIWFFIYFLPFLQTQTALGNTLMTHNLSDKWAPTYKIVSEGCFLLSFSSDILIGRMDWMNSLPHGLDWR